jgi:hypothetical protein
LGDKHPDTPASSSNKANRREDVAELFKVSRVTLSGRLRGSVNTLQDALL